MKYVDTKIVFSEVPKEVTLAINISNCPYKCIDCHSSYLQENIGNELTVEAFDNLINSNKGITCVCIMGGDSEPIEVDNIAYYIKDTYNLKVAWYSGNKELSNKINLKNFDFIKIGPYIEECGPLNNKNTNQIMYAVQHINNKYVLKDITDTFWK